MNLQQLGLLVLLLLPFAIVAEVSRLVLVASSEASRKLSVSITLSTWRPWFYVIGIVSIIAGAYAGMPWKAVVYGAMLLAVVILSAIFALSAKPRDRVGD